MIALAPYTLLADWYCTHDSMSIADIEWGWSKVLKHVLHSETLINWYCEHDEAVTIADIEWGEQNDLPECKLPVDDSAEEPV